MLTETEILKALYEAYNSHDLDRVASLYAPDACHVDVATGQPKQGRQAITEGLGALLSGFPEAHWTPTASAGESSLAFGRYELRGVLEQDLWSFTGAGQELMLPGVLVLECAEGLIQRSEDYWDAATFRRQMTHTHQGDQA